MADGESTGDEDEESGKVVGNEGEASEEGGGEEEEMEEIYQEISNAEFKNHVLEMCVFRSKRRQLRRCG